MFLASVTSKNTGGGIARLPIGQPTPSHRDQASFDVVLDSKYVTHSLQPFLLQKQSGLGAAIPVGKM